MKNYLSEEEIVLVEKFCDNEKQFEAVRKILLAGIYTHGTVQAGFKPDPLQNGAFALAALSTNNPITDEVMGQHIRGVWAGVNALENALIELKKIKADKKEDVISPFNEAV